MTLPTRDPAFVIEHQDFVRGLAKSLVYDDQLADDVAQATWLAAFEHPPEHSRSLRGWLATIVRNIALKAQRSNRSRAQREREAARAEAVPSADEILAREAVRKDVIQAVLELDEPYRSTVILRWFEGLEPREIARRSGVSRETVHTRIARAHALLRAKLDRDHGRRTVWAIALVRGFKIDPPPAASLAFVAKSVLPAGVSIMSGKKLMLAAIAVILLAVFAVWRFELGSTSAVGPNTSAPAIHAAPGVPVAVDRAPIESAVPASGDRREVAAPVAVPELTTPPKPTEGSLRLSVTWSDKTPAAGVGVTAIVWRGPDPYHRTRRATTDATGSVLFEHLVPGPTTIHLDRNKEIDCVATIVSGEETTKTIQLTRSFDVEGIVVDAQGLAVADAEIFMSSFGMGDSFDGFVVTHSASDGSFKVRDAASMTCFSARAPMRSPTSEHSIGSGAGRRVSLRLVFEGPGGELTGRVVGPDARPIARASVLVGADGTRIATQFRFPDGSLGLKPPAQLALTDERGEFRVRGVELGTWPLQVRAVGFAPLRTEVAIDAGRTTRRELELVRAPTLSGSVRDVHGGAIAGASVQVLPRGLFTTPLAITADDGSFTLGDLPTGEIKIEAERDERGRAEQTFIAEPGAELRGEFVLSTGKVLSGRVVAPGQKVEGWAIDAEGMPGEPAYFETARTDAEGRFRFLNCPDMALRVQARGSGFFVVKSLENVRAGERELVIEIDPSQAPSIRIRGRVVDESGKPIAASISPSNMTAGGVPIERNDPDTGAFALGDFAPGDWRIAVRAAGFATVQVGPHHVERNEVWDLGDVALQHGSALKLEFTRQGGGELSLPRVRVEDAEDMWYDVQTHGDHALSELLAPGRYTLHVFDDEQNAAQSRTFEMRAGQDAELRITLNAGRAVDFELHGSADPIELEIRDASGVWLHRSKPPRSSSALRRVRLLPGTYALSVKSGEKLTAQSEFEVGVDGPTKPIAVELR